MKLKELIPMLFVAGTASEKSTVRIEIYPEIVPCEKYVYEGKICDFYKDIVLTESSSSSYGDSTFKCGVPIGEFSVLDFTRYNENGVYNDIPEYNWPINIRLY